MAVSTSKVEKIEKNIALGEECTVSLVSYATTRLHIGIFPIIKIKDLKRGVKNEIEIYR